MASPTAGRVVLLHGQPGAGAQWHTVRRALGPAVESLAPDRPGYGRSPLPRGGIAENTDWLVEFLADAGGDPAIVVAHSWAGAVGLEAARRRPELVRGLVLLASVGPGAVNLFDRVLAMPLIGEAMIRPLFRVGDPLLRRVVAREVSDDALRAELLASMDDNRQRQAWRTFLTEQSSLVRDLPPAVEDLAAIATPTLVVAGTRDRIVPFSVARRLADAMPAAQLVPVEGGRHDLHRTHPEVVAAAVHRLLDATARR